MLELPADRPEILGQGCSHEFLIKVLETLPVEPYGLAAAEAHGLLLAHVHGSGTKHGAKDVGGTADAYAQPSSSD